MRRTLKKAISLSLALMMCLSLLSIATPAVAVDEVAGDTLRPMEYLTRGLVAATLEEGVYLSWRLLGDEPDGISFNVYRDGVKIATIEPRDVQPESNYEENPGIVKENTTPTNYTDAAGTASSVYTVAPVIDGVEGAKQGLSVPMLTANGNGATMSIATKDQPGRVPLPSWEYRGRSYGSGGTGTNQGKNGWYEVDMDLLREFRTANENGDGSYSYVVPNEDEPLQPIVMDDGVVTQAVLDNWVARLNEYNTTPNFLGNKTYESATWAPTAALGEGGIVTDALYAELEAEFIKYVENLDSGPSLPYAMNGDSVRTGNSNNYSLGNMSVGDFDGDGEYEIVVQWKSNSPDPMTSEPLKNVGISAAPEYYDVYKLDGTLLFRVDTGYNVTSGNNHESPILVGDFDNDGKSELMLKTGLGARIGNWDEAQEKVVYRDDPADVVGGELGLNAVQEKIKEYFATGDTDSLLKYYAVLSNFTISYRNPDAGSSGTDGPNDLNKEWIKTYHTGRMGPAVDDNEFISAFKYDESTGMGVLLDSAKHPFPFEASVDGETWAMTPNSQRGNFSYLALPSEGLIEGGGDAYKMQVMKAKEAYWLTNPWKAAVWGDAQGNRASRYLGGIACLDGENWYAVFQRGYYVRTTLAACNIVDGKVNIQACFDSDDEQYWSLGGSAYDYQNRGNHQSFTGDIDKDGKDEYILRGMSLKLNDEGDKILPYYLYGDMMPSIESYPTLPAKGTRFATDEIRNDPTSIWSPYRHGDVATMLPIDKNNTYAQYSGSEEFVLDNKNTGRNYGWNYGSTGQYLMEGRHLNDEGEIVTTNSTIYDAFAAKDEEIRSGAGNYSNRWPGAQGVSNLGMNSFVTGELVGTGTIGGYYALWWDGDLVHEGANGSNVVKINDESFAATTLYAHGAGTNGGKSTPVLIADMFGDWRTEILGYSGTTLRICTTTMPTEYGIRTLMHDPMFRCAVGTKNAGYDQMGLAGFYLGDEAELPAQRTDIYVPTREIPEGPAMPLNVEYNPITADSVTITWDAVEGADGYNIYRRNSKSSTAERIATINSVGYFDGDVEAGTDYWYSVSAYNANGESAKTKEAYILLAADESIELTKMTVKTSAGHVIGGSRLRLGDLNGDGRTDILVCNTTNQGDYARNSSVMYLLVAYDMEGNILWEFTIDPDWDGKPSGVTRSSADEPVQIVDIDGDGYNDVIAFMHPSKSRGTNYGGAVFVVLDGKTGQIKKDIGEKEMKIALADMPTPPGMTDTTSAVSSSNSNYNSKFQLTDCLVTADLDGRGMNNHLILKTRYNNVSAVEMLDTDGNFVFNFLWRDIEGRAGQSQAGHYPLAADLDGDGKDEIVHNYSVFKGTEPDAGNENKRKSPEWAVPTYIVDKDGNQVYVNGTALRATDHVDTIQVGDALGDGNLYIVFGGGGNGVSSFCYDIDGNFIWGNNSAIEPQSLNLGNFRTDANGMQLYGLDRRNRGNYPSGKDGMFLIDAYDGNELFKEEGNPMGWSSIVIRVDNWNGDYSPLCLSFFRNDQSRAAAVSGNYPVNGTGAEESRLAWINDYRKPALYDGYVNTLFEMDLSFDDVAEIFDSAADWRYMAMDLVGDARTELLAYKDNGVIIIYYNNANGDVKTDSDKLDVLRSGITGEPKQQTYFMANYSRYPTDVTLSNIEDRTPAQPQAYNVTETSAYIDWTPIVTATGYTLYRNGEKIGDFTDIGYQDNDLVAGVEYKYTVTASDGKGVSPESLPLVLKTVEDDKISASVGHATIVEGLAAYLNVTALANFSGDLTAYLEVGGELLYATPVVDGGARMYIPAAPAAGSYKVVVKSGEVAGSAAITVVEHNRGIWTATAFQAENSNLSLKFNAKVGLTKTASATAGDAAYTPSVSGNDTIELPVAYESLEAGTVVSVKGVILTELFPSYSFTFKTTIIEDLTPVYEGVAWFNFGISNAPEYNDGERTWTQVLISGTGNVNNGTPLLPYSAEQGWGIVSREASFQGRTRSGSNNMMNTWVGGNGSPWEFKVNLPNGTYKASVYGTDLSGTNNITVNVNGVSSGYKTINQTNLEPIVVENIVVADGVMHFTFTGNADNGNQGYVNGIVIEQLK